MAKINIGICGYDYRSKYYLEVIKMNQSLYNVVGIYVNNSIEQAKINVTKEQIEIIETEFDNWY